MSGAPADKPNFALNPVPVAPRVYPNLANASQVDYGVHMDLVGGEVPKVTPMTTGIFEDEMSMSWLLKKLSYLKTVTLTTAMVSGDVLAALDLCPCSELFYKPFGATFPLSLPSYISMPFTFWQGSMIFKIVVVASGSHTARLQICSHYGFEAVGLSIDAAMGQYTALFEVNGVSEVTVKFPWRSPKDMKLVPAGAFAESTEYSMGQFSLRVLTPLQAPEVVSTSVDVNIYYRMGDDTRLGFVGANLADMVVSQAAGLTSVHSLDAAQQKKAATRRSEKSYIVVKEPEEKKGQKSRT